MGEKFHLAIEWWFLASEIMCEQKIFFKLQNNVYGLILGTHKCDEP